MQSLAAAHRLSPSDPLVCNELGVLAYRCRRYQEAASWLGAALELTPPSGTAAAAWEPTWVNLGHALRKLRQWDDALEAFRRALALAPGQPGTYAAMGYTLHLAGRWDEAVEQYHTSLGLRSQDAFTASMLQAALVEANDEVAKALEREQDPQGRDWLTPL